MMHLKKANSFLKMIIVLLVSILFLYDIQALQPSIKEEKWVSKSCEEKNRILSKHMMSYLGPTIDNCLTTHYGQPKQAFTRIIYIDPHIPNDEIQIEAKTFTGPHNPPYGKDILTFSIAPGGTITLVDYQHSEIDTIE